ncbi:O-antigen polymerase [Calditerrivibrio nitroreducens]|nr:O-antigen polymerase [Calditerrivibrio nitroreducens]
MGQIRFYNYPIKSYFFLFLTIVIFSISSFILILYNPDNAEIILLSFLYFCLASFIIWENYNKKHIIEFTHPIVFYSFLWSIPFGIIPLFIVFTKEPQTYLPKSYMYIDLIPTSQIIAIVSLLFLYLGFKFYNLISPYRSSEKTFDKKTWNNYLFYFTLFLMLFLIILEILYLIERNAFILGYVEDLSEHKPSVLSYFLALFGYDRISIFYLVGPLLITLIHFSYNQNKILRYILFILVLFNIFISFISAQKERIALTLIAIFFYFYYYTRDKNKLQKKENIIIIFIFAFLILFPYFNEYRLALNLGMDLEFILRNPDLIFENINLESFSYIFQRFDHLNTTLSVIGQTPTFIDYKMGITYLKGLEALLLVLPFTRKSEDFGLFNNTFAREYNLVEPFDYYSGITLPQFAEIYMNLGFYAVPLGMFLIGILYSYIYNLINSSNPKVVYN